MKTRILLCIFLFINLLSNSQDIQDVLFLRNGSIIRGVIIAKDTTQVKIETCCGNLLVYNTAEIQDIDRESVVREGTGFKEKGYYNITSMGSLIGAASNTNSAPFSFVSEQNWRINNYIMGGINVGYELLNEATLPIGVNLKGLLPSSHNIYFLGMSGGYSISLDNPDKDYYKAANGGYYASAEIGAMILISNNSAFFLAAGYRYSELKYTREDWWMGDVERLVHYNRFTLRFGISFY